MNFTKPEIKIIKEAVGVAFGNETDPSKLEEAGKLLAKINKALEEPKARFTQGTVDKLVDRVIDLCAEAGNEDVEECTPVKKELESLASSLLVEVRVAVLQGVLKDVEVDRKGELESGWSDEDVKFLKTIFK